MARLPLLERQQLGSGVRTARWREIFDSGANAPDAQEILHRPRRPSPAFCFASPALYTLAARRSVRSARILSSLPARLAGLQERPASALS